MKKKKDTSPLMPLEALRELTLLNDSDLNFYRNAHKLFARVAAWGKRKQKLQSDKRIAYLEKRSKEQGDHLTDALESAAKAANRELEAHNRAAKLMKDLKVANDMSKGWENTAKLCETYHTETAKSLVAANKEIDCLEAEINRLRDARNHNIALEHVRADE